MSARTSSCCYERTVSCTDERTGSCTDDVDANDSDGKALRTISEHTPSDALSDTISDTTSDNMEVSSFAS
jgi:hypothetical protein